MQRLHGGSGTRAIAIALHSGDAVLNDTEGEYEINYSYSTVANGGADRIAIQPGEVAWLRSKGGASDFAKWDIGFPDELPDTVNVRQLSSIL
jgi:hypothetical protein